MPAILPIPRRYNYGRPTEYIFGPWSRGLISKFVPELLDAHTLVGCDNFKVLESGEIQVRPAFVQIYEGTDWSSFNSSLYYTIAFNVKNIPFVFHVRRYGGSGSLSQVTCKSYTGTAASSTQNTGYTTTVPCGIVYYNGYIYVYPSNVNWDGTIATDGLVSYGSKLQYDGDLHFTSIASITSYIFDFVFSYRDRVFGVRNSILYFSRTAAPDVWSGDLDAGFINVGEDNADNITALITTRSTLYIFKTNKTYILNYTTLPTDGVLELINPTIGVIDSTCVAQYENHIYIASDKKIYEIIGSTVTSISNNIYNPNIAFFSSIVIFRDILLVKATFKDGSNKFYCFNLESRCWTTWTAPDPILYSGKISTVSFEANTHGNYLTSNILRQTPLFSCKGVNDLVNFYIDTNYVAYPDVVSPGGYSGSGNHPASAPITASAETQDYDGGPLSTNAWKRIYTVTANLFLPNGAAGNASMYLNDERNILNDGTATLTLENQTYAAPVGGGGAGGTTPNDSMLGNIAYYIIKFFSSMRSRRFSYKITLVDSGSAPTSIYRLVALVRTTVNIESSSGN